jgi:hypothetical protein
MDNPLIVLSNADMKQLLEMAISETLVFRIGDRHFTIIDTEFLRDIAEKAKIKFVTVE